MSVYAFPDLGIFSNPAGVFCSFLEGLENAFLVSYPTTSSNL
jgi:hypothetical protein